MQSIVLIIHLLICAAIIGLVLVQQGKGSEAGAAFGSGASGTFFGASGSTTFLYKITRYLAILFFATCLILGYLTSSQNQRQKSVITDLLPKTMRTPASGSEVPDAQKNGADTSSPQPLPE